MLRSAKVQIDVAPVVVIVGVRPEYRLPVGVSVQEVQPLRAGFVEPLGFEHRPQGRMAGIIQPPLVPQAIAADLSALTSTVAC